MVVPESSINNIMSGLESTGGVTLHNHRRKLKQKFETVAKLGQGTYGKVQLGINKETGQEVAIKTIKKCKIETEADLIRIRREIQIMSSLRHPYIIHIYEVFENRDKMVLVMEYAAGGELYDYLSKQKVLQEAEARRIFRQIAMAVYYCHKHQICHRDLKLENILLDENGNAKIADFGLSNVFDSGRLLSTFCGSPLYASPEIVKGIPYLGPEVDCWSLGVLLYTLVYGAMPFDGSNFKRLVRQISAGEYYEPKTPSSASELIAGLLTVSGTDRFDITGVCKHTWMAEEGKVSCYRLAVELAEEIPNRLDLLLALAPSKTQIKVPEDKPVDKPARSQSLSNIPMHQTFTHIPKVSEEKSVASEKIEEKSVESEEKPKEKERKRSKSDKKPEEDKDRPKKKSIKTKEKQIEPVTNSEVPKEDLAALLEQAQQVKVTDSVTVAPEKEEKEEPKLAKVEKEVVSEKSEEKPAEKPKEKKVTKVTKVKKEIKDTELKVVKKDKEEKPPEPEVKPERKKSRVLEAAEMFSRSPSQEKTQPKKAKVSPEKRPSITEEKKPEFCLASTINVNKLFMNELNKDAKQNDAPVKDEEKLKKENAIKVISHAISESELNEKKSSTLPRRKLSRTTVSEPRIEPERMVANTKVSQIIYPTPPIPPPRPSLLKQESSKERIIPIQIEKRDDSEKPAPLSKQASISSRTSSISSIGRQDSDSSTTTTCEPIRKSPREVIIPIAVEGGGFVTPSVSTLSKMNSVSESEEDLPLRGFSLHSTRKRNKHGNETTDSLSSDEDDDNFEILTTENLFSTLLSRMRNLTQRLDEGRPTFPRLFNSSIFDTPSHRRLTETKSFNSDDDPTPWRKKSPSTASNSSTLPRVLTSKSLRRLLSKDEFPPAVRRIKRTTSDTVQKNGHDDGLERVKKYLDELNSETVGRKEISKHLRPRTVYYPGSSQTSEFEKYINYKQSLEKDRRFLAMSPSLNSHDRLKELKEFRKSISENNEYEPTKSPSKSILEKYLYNDLDKKVKKDESKVDKAIKSLRKNSQSIENQFSESKLLKRAVSLEDINNPLPRNKRASSLKPGFEQKELQKVNKKGGVFEVIKKIENKPDDDRKSESTEDVQSFVSVTDNSDTWSSSDPTERFFDTANPTEDNVLERIRRKSFYHRFNLPKRNVYRRSSSNMERKRYF